MADTTRKIQVGDRVRCSHKRTGTVVRIDDSFTRDNFVYVLVQPDEWEEGRTAGYRLSDLTLLEAAPATQAAERSAPTRTGCSACGDDVPAMRTPRGWLCRDCAAGY